MLWKALMVKVLEKKLRKSLVITFTRWYSYQVVILTTDFFKKRNKKVVDIDNEVCYDIKVAKTTQQQKQNMNIEN